MKFPRNSLPYPPMKNILITGGAGFIGSNLAFELQNRYPKAVITVIDDFRVGHFKNLIGFKGDVMAYDVADSSWFPILQRKPIDVIFHMASITDTTVHDQKKMIYDNVEGFRLILDLATAKTAKMVYASSAAVYGSQAEQMKEEDGGIPNNVYGFSKWALENLAREYAGRIKPVGLRFFNVFGPREYYKGAAASMTYQLYLQMKSGKRPRIFKSGEQKRDFIYVKDVVDGIILAANAKESTVLNIGTGKATSFNEVVSALNEALRTKLEPDYFDNPYDFYQDFTQADISHTKAAIGFEPRYSTREGILDYVKNYLLPDAEKSKRLVPPDI